RTRAAQKKAKQPLLAATGYFSQLSVGDFLVHQLHGVGRYRGLVKLPVSARRDARQGEARSAPPIEGDREGSPLIEALHLEYDGGQLYLPVYRLGEVQRYV